jgi:hypothetical protein
MVSLQARRRVPARQSVTPVFSMASRAIDGRMIAIEATFVLFAVARLNTDRDAAS